jgi:D-citramalate synthase
MPKDRPSTTLSLKLMEKSLKNTQGDGQFDAFMNALAKYIRVKFRTTKIDYAVRIRQEVVLMPYVKPS